MKTNTNRRELIEQNRRKLSIKSMYFNRYLFVRYVTVFFFFANIHWLISLHMSNSPLYFIPLILLIVILISIIEQVKLYSNHTNNVKYTRYCFNILLYANIVFLLLACFSTTFSMLYPFLLNDMKSKVLAIVILFLEIWLSRSILNRLNKIRRNEDKHYERIKQYEEFLN